MNKLFAVAVATIGLTACSNAQSLTGPTAVVTQQTPRLQYDWTITAEGCQPTHPFPSVSMVEPERTLDMPSGARRAFYPLEALRQVSPLRTEQRYIVAEFRAVPTGWGICAWEEAVRETIACTVDSCG